MRKCKFVFDYVNLLHNKCHKINLDCGGSYRDSPDWIENKKATINPIDKKVNKCFQYIITVRLNYEEKGKHVERITKIKTFIIKYDCDGISYPSKKKQLEKI